MERNISRVNCLNLTIFKPHNFSKKDHSKKSFHVWAHEKLLETNFLTILNCYDKFCSRKLSWKDEKLFEEKKPSTNFPFFFRKLEQFSERFIGHFYFISIWFLRYLQQYWQFDYISRFEIYNFPPNYKKAWVAMKSKYLRSLKLMSFG